MPHWLEKFAARPQRSILVLSLALLLAGNWILPLTDRDETRFAEASREMIQRGDFVVPWFNGAWRFDKPVLIYWCQIASYKILGENDFAARLPSVLFTVATALLVGADMARGKGWLAADGSEWSFPAERFPALGKWGAPPPLRLGLGRARCVPSRRSFQMRPRLS